MYFTSWSRGGMYNYGSDSDNGMSSKFRTLIMPCRAPGARTCRQKAKHSARKASDGQTGRQGATDMFAVCEVSPLRQAITRKCRREPQKAPSACPRPKPEGGKPLGSESCQGCEQLEQAWSYSVCPTSRRRFPGARCRERVPGVNKVKRISADGCLRGLASQ